MSSPHVSLTFPLSALNTQKIGTHDAFVVMRVPEWFPGAQWKREGKKWALLVKDMIVKPWERVKLEEVRGRLAVTPQTPEQS